MRMMNPEESRGIIIRTRHTDEGFIGPLPEKVLETPSSSSLVDYVAAGICSGAGSSAGREKTPEGWPVKAGVILAQPASCVVPGAAWMESLEEPVCESVTATRTSAAEPIVGFDSSAAAPEAARGDPAAATLEAAREEHTAAAPEPAGEEHAAAVGEADELLERILEEAAISLAREDAPGPPQPGPSLESRPMRPARRLWESRKLASAVIKVVEQRDQVIVDREAEIAWLDAKLAALGSEHREEMATLEAVMASMETKIASLRAENARLKEEEDRSKASKKRLADRISTLENELGLRIRPRELEGMLHARMFEGVQVCRRLLRLIDPDFPVQYIHLENRGVQHKNDLMEEPQDSQRWSPPL